MKYGVLDFSCYCLSEICETGYPGGARICHAIISLHLFMEITDGKQLFELSDEEVDYYILLLPILSRMGYIHTFTQS